LDAFESAIERVKDSQTIDTLIWENRDIPNCERIDLRIRPQLIDKGNRRHLRKLFDSSASKQEISYVKHGSLYDISLQRPPLIGFKKSKKVYIGN
jgi:hypothetical protein